MIIKKLSNFLAGAIAIGIFVAAFMAYFVRTADIEKSVFYDGLGRLLIEAPVWARFFLGKEYLWAGLWWHLIDILVVFGGIYVALKLHEYGSDE